MLEPTSEPVTTHWNDHDDPNQETIALLQDEIARLEAELHARDEALRLRPSPPEAADDDRLPDDGLRRRVDELNARRAGRARRDGHDPAGADPTLRGGRRGTACGVGAAQSMGRGGRAASRRSRQRRPTTPRRARLRAAPARRSLRRSADAERRDWECSQRVGLEREAAHLRELLARQPKADGRDDDRVHRPGAENRRLRTTCARLESVGRRGRRPRPRGSPRPSSSWTRPGASSRAAEDDRRRERIEHEAVVGALRSQLARESLQQQAEPLAAFRRRSRRGRPALDADERIRAFRQHLKDLHENEAARRADRSIASRLSRLWHHTGPG